MIIHTASEGITLSKKLETDSSDFYEDLAQRYNKDAEIFLAFAKENKKNIAQIERAYYGVITDAIEGGYAFNLDTDNYSLPTAVKDGAEYTEVLGQAIEIEKTIVRYYTDAAEQAKSFLADVPRAFTIIARKRGSRLEKLESLR
jgi:rubrerythrin